MVTTAILLVLGLLYIGVGIRALISPEFISNLMDDFEYGAGLTYLTGVIMVASCTALLLVHNDWAGWQMGVATFILWAGLIKGFMILALPNTMVAIWRGFFKNGRIHRAVGVFILAMGAALIWWALS